MLFVNFPGWFEIETFSAIKYANLLHEFLSVTIL